MLQQTSSLAAQNNRNLVSDVKARSAGHSVGGSWGACALFFRFLVGAGALDVWPQHPNFVSIFTSPSPLVGLISPDLSYMNIVMVFSAHQNNLLITRSLNSPANPLPYKVTFTGSRSY